MSTQPSLVLSGGFGTIYGWQFTRGGTNTSAINRINSQNTADTCYLEVNEGQNIKLTNGVTSITGDFLIQQTTYPPTDTIAIGYTITKTFGPANASDTTGTYSNIGSQALGTVKGVYFISCGFSLTASNNDTMNNKAVILSLTSGTSDVPVNAYGAWEYYDEINDSIGGAGGLRYVGTLCGVYTKTTTSAQTLYLNAYANTTGAVTISVQGNCSITRIA